MTKTSTKHSVRIRKKELKNGAKSLYLDIWYKGKREYEFLKLYLVNPKDPFDRESNRENEKLAERIRAKRQMEMNDNEYGSDSTFMVDTLLFPYFQSMLQSRKDSLGNFGDASARLERFDACFCRGVSEGGQDLVGVGWKGHRIPAC